MEQNREPRNGLTLIQSMNLLPRSKVNLWTKDLLTNGAVTTSHLHTKKSESRHIPNTLHKMHSKWSMLLLLLRRFSCVRLCATPQTAAHQAPPSLGFSRQEHWSGLLFPSKWSIVCQSLSLARLFVTPWTAAHQAPLSMRFSRKGYWSELPFPSPGDLSNPGIEPWSPALQAYSLLTELYRPM